MGKGRRGFRSRPRRLEPKLEIVDFFRARLLLEAGEPAKAQPFIERFLKNVPTEAEGWFLRGDVLGALGQHEAGALDYAEGIGRAPHPRPDISYGARNFWPPLPTPTPRACSRHSRKASRSFGPVISLLEYAITLELEQKNYDGRAGANRNSDGALTASRNLACAPG